MTRLLGSITLGLLLAHTLPAVAAGPIPLGEADVTFSYMSDTGMRVLNSSVDYSGVDSGDVIPLGGSSEIGYFNSLNLFGRRPLIDGAIRDNESLLTHAFFKPNTDHSVDFFDGIVADTSVTLEVRNIQFAEPVWIQHDTVMMHKLWDVDQVDLLPNFYINVHNQDTETDPFRDSDDFFPLVFNNFPRPNYDLAALSDFEVFDDGTHTIGFRITVPYSRLRNFEDVGQSVPPGLPAPHGFLEPFHFHVEFAVSNVPEPATAMLLLTGLSFIFRRRSTGRIS